MSLDPEDLQNPVQVIQGVIFDLDFPAFFTVMDPYLGAEGVLQLFLDGPELGVRLPAQ